MENKTIQNVKVNQCPTCRQTGYKLSVVYEEYGAENTLTRIMKCSQCKSEFVQRFALKSVQVD
jgi:hypothetical protein